MASEHNLINHRPWWHRTNRVQRNPFDPVELTQHLEWCRTCKMDVDVQVEAANAGGVDVYRKRCKRCGGVMQHGIARRFVTAENKKPLPRKAWEFIKQLGRDRR